MGAVTLTRHPTDETLQAFAEIVDQGLTVEQLKAVRRMREDSIRRYIDWCKDAGMLPPDTRIEDGRIVHADGQPFGPVDHINIEEEGETMVVSLRTCSDITVDQALARAGVDGQAWGVVKTKREADLTYGPGAGRPNSKPGVFEAPVYKLTVWLRKRQHDVSASVEHIAKAFAGAAPAFKPTKQPWPESGVLVEASFPDLHVGKHSWGRQTGEDYDHKLAVEGFNQAASELLSRAATLQPERILLPVGNDLLHVDNLEGATTRGTPQDVDTRPQLLFDRTVEMLVGFIRDARQLAPVDVLIIPGNHDELTCHHIGAALQGWFHDCDDVTVDNEPPFRKYYRWGTVLLGYCHGGKDDPKLEDLPLIMAQEAPVDWAATTHREWHTGHIHRRRTLQWLATDSKQGIHVRTLPALCAVDAWHSQHGYVGQPRVAEMYVWHTATGYVGHFASTPL